MSFALERDAGRFSCEGTFRRGEGAGHFTFAPRPEFVAAMRGLGYVLDDEKLYSMAILDVSREFVRQLDALGYARLELDDLLSLRIHGADPTFIREVKELGYDHLPVEDLATLPAMLFAGPRELQHAHRLSDRRIIENLRAEMRVQPGQPQPRSGRDTRGGGIKRIQR